jgi:hypothetical protein
MAENSANPVTLIGRDASTEFLLDTPYLPINCSSHSLATAGLPDGLFSNQKSQFG